MVLLLLFPRSHLHATREAMCLVDKFTATSTFTVATAVQSYAQHQIASTLSWSSTEPGSARVPDSKTVRNHIMTVLSIIFFLAS